MRVRTRFAPSPTGHLHVGGARTAIINWLFARHHQGEFVLRIEDTDIERNVPGAESEILDDLRWLGLDWDEGPDVGGASAPYRQSQRGEIYQARARAMLEDGAAYGCTCPPREAEAGHMRDRCACAHRPMGWPLPADASLRFLVPEVERVVLEDAVRGTITFPIASIEDFVLLRSDGRPTYNFAAAVDDAEMAITHVVRGSDHLNNTPKQVLLHRAFGGDPPVYAHIPLILGADRQKLSKRHGATSVAEHRRIGYLPEALLNYLSLLSWSSETGDEVLTADRLIEEIDLSRVGASDAVFDVEKLRWLSSQYAQMLDPRELGERILRETKLASSGLEPAPVGEALRDRIAVLFDAPEALEAFGGPASPEETAARLAIFDDESAVGTLAAVHDALAALEDWNADAIGQAIRTGGAAAGAKGRALFAPVRLALTGREHGPELPRIARVIGREQTLAALTDPHRPPQPLDKF